MNIKEELKSFNLISVEHDPSVAVNSSDSGTLSLITGTYPNENRNSPIDNDNPYIKVKIKPFLDSAGSANGGNGVSGCNSGSGSITDITRIGVSIRNPISPIKGNNNSVVSSSLDYKSKFKTSTLMFLKPIEFESQGNSIMTEHANSQGGSVVVKVKRHARGLSDQFNAREQSDPKFDKNSKEDGRKRIRAEQHHYQQKAGFLRDKENIDMSNGNNYVRREMKG